MGEAKRIVDVLDKQLSRDGGRTYVCGEQYTIADMAIYPWIRCLDVGYKASEFLQLDQYRNVRRWRDTLEAREAVKRGLRVNGWGPDAVRERHSKEDFFDNKETVVDGGESEKKRPRTSTTTTETPATYSSRAA